MKKWTQPTVEELNIDKTANIPTEELKFDEIQEDGNFKQGVGTSGSILGDHYE